jgi:hypothetical protein
MLRPRNCADRDRNVIIFKRHFTCTRPPTKSFALQTRISFFLCPNYSYIALSGPLRTVCKHRSRRTVWAGGPNISYCLHDNGHEKVFDYLFLRVVRVAVLLYPTPLTPPHSFCYYYYYCCCCCCCCSLPRCFRKKNEYTIKCFRKSTILYNMYTAV